MSATVPPFGPYYPIIPSVNKYRKAANAKGGVMQLEKSYRQKYGAAVEKAIRALQHADMQKVYKMPVPNCASGSWGNTAEIIESAVKARQKRELVAAAKRDREGRSDEQVFELYKAAMQEKRNR